MIFVCDEFSLLDENKFFQHIYSGSGFIPKPVFYDIMSPFLMDSQRISPIIRTSNLYSRKKKRINSTPTLDMNRTNSEHVKQIHKQFCLISSLNFLNYNIDCRNAAARDAVKNCPTFSVLNYNSSSLDTENICASSIIDFSQPILFQNGNQFLSIPSSSDFGLFCIPPLSSFLYSDVSMIRHFAHRDRKFDLIVMDPAWPNKSAKRKKSYDWICLDDLRDLPIAPLLSQTGLLCIWLTNNKRVHDFVYDLIQNEWGLKTIGKWFWLKISKNGDPVYPFDSGHKVPFEILVFATLKSQQRLSFPRSYTLLSVPNAIPSRKPPISIILQNLGHLSSTEGSNVLELYARYLLPNVTSVGNEVLKFQNEYFFEKES